MGIVSQRIAITTLNAAVLYGMAVKLILVKRLDVSAVILVEVRKLIIQQYRRMQRIRYVELNMARMRRYLVVGAVSVLYICHIRTPCRLGAGGYGIFEVGCDFVTRYCVHLRTCRGGGVAFRVVDDNLLHF